MHPEELAFIKGAKGRLTAKDLGECYGVSLRHPCAVHPGTSEQCGGDTQVSPTNN